MFSFCRRREPPPMEGCIVFVHGISSAGKSATCHAFLQSCPAAVYLAEDQEYTFGSSKVKLTKLEKTRRMCSTARGMAENGKVVLIDQVDLFGMYTNEATETLRSPTLIRFDCLLYCPIQELMERCKQRNESRRLREERSFWRTLVQFGLMYNGTHDPPEGEDSIDVISRNHLEETLKVARMYDPFGTTAVRDKRQTTTRDFLLKMMHFQNFNSVEIFPRMKHDLVINTAQNTPDQVAQLILKEIGWRTGTAAPTILATPRRIIFVSRLNEPCADCKTSFLRAHDADIQDDYCDTCLAFLQLHADGDWTDTGGSSIHSQQGETGDSSSVSVLGEESRSVADSEESRESDVNIRLPESSPHT